MLLKAVILVAGFFLAACSSSSEEVRYRLIVEVKTPEGVKTGSGVMGFQLAPGFPQAYAPTFRGEAVAVDLGSRGTLFMTLAKRTEDGMPSGEVMGMLPERVFRRVGITSRIEKENAGDRIATLDFLAKQTGKKAYLRCVYEPLSGECPFFVRFGNVNDPASVEAVNPDNLSGSFGEGVSLKAITIELTRDEVTTGIAERLTWLKNHDGPLKPRLERDIPMAEWPLSARLKRRSFIKEHAK